MGGQSGVMKCTHVRARASCVRTYIHMRMHVHKHENLHTHVLTHVRMHPYACVRTRYFRFEPLPPPPQINLVLQPPPQKIRTYHHLPRYLSLSQPSYKIKKNNHFLTKLNFTTPSSEYLYPPSTPIPIYSPHSPQSCQIFNSIISI